MREITYKIFTFLLIGSVLISCSKENTGYGALSLSLKGDISVGISSNSATKAGEINTEDFEIFVGDKSMGLKKELEDPITLAIGTYTVSAQNCSQSTANNGSGLLRFYGEDNNVTITTGETSTATIKCKVVNSKVSILLGDSYTSYFDMGYTSVSVSDGTRDLVVVENGAVTAEAVYFDAGKTLTITVNSKKTPASGAAQTFQTTETLSTVAATWHKITVNADLNLSGGIKFTTQDSHVSDWISISDYIPGSVVEDN